jgi:hypothetical protein
VAECLESCEKQEKRVEGILVPKFTVRRGGRRVSACSLDVVDISEMQKYG